MSKDNFEKPVVSTVTNETKKIIFNQTLSTLNRNKNTVLTGSLSQVLSEMSYENETIDVSSVDFSNVNDIDVGLCGSDYRSNKVAGEQLEDAGDPDFKIEANYLTDAFASRIGDKGKGIGWVTLNDGQNEYKIQVMTPAYLLVTLVDQDVSELTSVEKYKRKILEIQGMKSFSKEDFIAISRFDIDQRYQMNKDTFERWKRTAKELAKELKQDEKEVFLGDYDNFQSIVDQVEFMEWFKSVGSVEQLDYDFVRKVTNLEKFVREMEE